MSTQFATLTEVSNQISGFERVYIRMAARKAEDGRWITQTMVADVPPAQWLNQPESPLDNWPQPIFCYDYGHALLVAKETAAQEAAEWFANPSAEHRLTLASAELDATTQPLMFYWPDLPATGNANWVKSADLDGFTPMQWPHTVYRWQPSTATPLSSRDYDPLVGDVGPFFPDLRTGVYYLLHGVGDYARASTQTLQDVLAVRVIHAEGWLRTIHITPTKLSIDVGGLDLLNSRVILGGSPQIDGAQPVNAPGTVEFILPSTMPQQVTMALVRRDRLLDLATLDARWSPFGHVPRNAVMEADNLEARIEELCARGEGVTIEFKQAIPKDDDQFLKTVAAFANGSGGVFLIGVENKTGVVKGMQGDVNDEKDRITNMIHSNVFPMPALRMEVCLINRLPIIAIFVDQGDKPPYGLHPSKTLYYVRRGATTYEARPEEIAEIVMRSRSNTILPF